jgi:hypothetical protein
MVKCKIFRKSYDSNVKDNEEQLNQFLENKRIITIQITSVPAFLEKDKIIKPFDTIYIFYKTGQNEKEE